MHITFKSEKAVLKAGQGFSLAEGKPKKGLPYRIEIPIQFISIIRKESLLNVTTICTKGN
ncbi:MAG: hypothetical protein JETT_2834 [Candidatus Jettenia ecosi]|uniref:Uncharacterized protein n=1 Tax=Candidatus Jettenia ecosi TaxID=2494326 RepID=A0A533Q8E5_9BACT|nr:MAG: hypothetical protein JETT_2834 [Candidatus Jettenia ecosi]